jgi:hypothetical protein
MKRIFVLTLVVGLAGCTDTYDDQANKLYRFVEKNKIGSAPDYYLVKSSGFGGPERVALMYAMTDDYTFCNEIADFYMEKYPASRYSCEKAN